jgi:hypothetical protein
MCAAPTVVLPGVPATHERQLLIVIVGLCCGLYESRLQSSWTHLITPSRNFVEVQWRSLFWSTSLGKRCTFTTLYPLLENVLQTVDHFAVSCLGAPFSWLEKPRNRMGRDLNCMAAVLMGFHRSTVFKPNTKWKNYHSSLWWNNEHNRFCDWVIRTLDRTVEFVSCTSWGGSKNIDFTLDCVSYCITCRCSLIVG